MNLPWANPGPEAPEVPAGDWEAMAPEMNPRGMVYAACGLTFPPGEWVAVTGGQVLQLRWLPWVTLREKEAVRAV